MLSEKAWLRTEVKEIILYLFIIAMLGIIVPITFGFGFLGFQESIKTGVINIQDYLGQYLVYIPMIIGAILLIIFPLARLFTIKEGEHPSEQKDPKWFTILTISYIFAPEDGMLYRIFKGLGIDDKHNPMNWSKNWLRVTVIAILFFASVGFAQFFFPQLNVASVPKEAVLQQVSVGSDIAFGSGIPAIGENGVVLFAIFLLLGIDAYICAKLKWGLKGFFPISILIIIFGAFIWRGFHQIVYQNSEIALTSVWIFGLIGIALVIIFGNMIFYLAWHFFNNMSIKIQELSFAHEDIIFIYGLILFISIISYLIIEYLLWRRRKKHHKQIEEF